MKIWLWYRVCLWLLFGLAALALVLPAQAQQRDPVYYVTVAQGLTAPAAPLVQRALREAEAANATMLVIEMRGGGSLRTAWALARQIDAARVPVVVYIAPRGASGGAVGTVLLAASHVAVMAPAATTGFAAPLVDVPTGFSTSTQQLLVDDAVKQLSAWARARNRNAGWLEQAARSGAILDAERAQALQPPLIDGIATEQELLTLLQGRRVTLAGGDARTLQTLGAPIQRVQPTFLEGLGQLLAVPTIAFVLFVVGGIAIYLELANPGIGIPGVAGIILIIAALVGFALGEVRVLAVLLLAGGLIVVGLEHVVMSHGGLTIAGVVLLVIGALLLVDPMRSPGLQVSPLAIIGVAVMLGSVATALVALAVRVRGQRPVTGQDALIGQVAEVRQPIAPEGQVFVNGALWSAWTDEGPLSAGELVHVAGIDGLRLYVRKIDAMPQKVGSEESSMR